MSYTKLEIVISAPTQWLLDSRIEAFEEVCLTAISFLEMREQKGHNIQNATINFNNVKVKIVFMETGIWIRRVGFSIDDILDAGSYHGFKLTFEVPSLWVDHQTDFQKLTKAFIVAAIREDLSFTVQGACEQMDKDISVWSEKYDDVMELGMVDHLSEGEQDTVVDNESEEEQDLVVVDSEEEQVEEEEREGVQDVPESEGEKDIVVVLDSEEEQVKGGEQEEEEREGETVHESEGEQNIVVDDKSEKEQDLVVVNSEEEQVEKEREEETVHESEGEEIMNESEGERDMELESEGEMDNELESGGKRDMQDERKREGERNMQDVDESEKERESEGEREIQDVHEGERDMRDVHEGERDMQDVHESEGEREMGHESEGEREVGYESERERDMGYESEREGERDMGYESEREGERDMGYESEREIEMGDEHQEPQHPTVVAPQQTESTTAPLNGAKTCPNKAKGVNKRPREGTSPDASPRRATQGGKRIKRKEAPQLGSESLVRAREAPSNSPGKSYAETVLRDGADNGDGFKVVKNKEKRTPKEKPSGEKKELPKPPLKLRSTEAVKITASDPKFYEDALSSALHGKAEVTPLVNKRSLEIKDLDEATSEDEVNAALREKLGKPDLKMECRLLPRYRGTKVALPFRDQEPQFPTVETPRQTKSVIATRDSAAAGATKTKKVNKRPREGVSPDVSPQRATQSEKRIKRKDAPQLNPESLVEAKGASSSSPSKTYADTVLKDGADIEDDFKVVGERKKRAPGRKTKGEKKELTKPPSKLRSTEAVKITARDPKFYEGILPLIKEKVKPEDTGTVVQKIRRTFKQEVLLIVKKGGETLKFAKSLSLALHGKAEVIPLVNKRSLEIRDLDEATTESEVTSALEEKLGKSDLPIECKLLPRYKGTKVALNPLGRSRK
ncbi:zinc finger CCCH domain-containing protein 13-like [Leptopilina heterotoma]|uniref:zinc finger CCCH domain-containing protein 13-like n=1 Tax=Leptopilina heterotoma TaxID=63436 RepID=UPI001CA99CE3|nr:zinc finger CCCH domain-containing protein 13-like [Leptopilina heterotoma]